jgi:protein arginine phosphatase
MRLLFVCTGNICRSLMAERLARHLAETRGVPLEARSAGVAAESWYEPPQEVWNALAEHGVGKAPHRPQLVGREILAWADRVLVMTRGHHRAVVDAFPEHSRKTALLLEAAGLTGEVADPYGYPIAAYRESRRLIVAALERLIPAPGARGPA